MHFTQFSSRAYTLAASRLDMSHVEFATYTHDMRCDDSLVRVPDDKDRACMWLIPPVCYATMLLMYAILAPTWKQCPLSVQEANVITALTLLRIVPEGLHRWLQLDADVMWLPYVYVTVKSKCHSVLGPHEFTLVSPLSPTLVSHSGFLGPHEFTLVSPLSPTLVSHSVLGPHEFTLVSHTCLPLWFAWVA